MKDKIILVAGGTGPTRTSIVRYFLEKKATVIVPGKSLDEIKKLKAAVADIASGNLITQLAELPDYDSGFDIAETIMEKYGRIDIGISFFNGLPCSRKLTEVKINDWQNMVDNEVTPFFISALLILHTMKVNKGGLYISVCDSSAPGQPDFTPLSKIAANVKREISKMFADETKNYNIRYYHLGVKHTDTMNDPIELKPDAAVINSGLIGEHIMKLYLNETDKPDEIFQLVTEENTM